MNLLLFKDAIITIVQSVVLDLAALNTMRSVFGRVR
jgi:hypothetical protein